MRPPPRQRAPDTVRILVEVRVPSGGEDAAREKARTLHAQGFAMDADCPCICLPDPEDPEAWDKCTYAFRGVLPRGQEKDLERIEGVVKVWGDPRIDHVAAQPCSFAPVDRCTCVKMTSGNVDDVARVLGVDRLRAEGLDGNGIVVGIVDGGITAMGRPTSCDDLSDPFWDSRRDLIPSVIGGHPHDWGTRARTPWSFHGNSSASDVLAMAPGARLYDIRISDDVTPQTPGARVSGACEGYGWALDQHRRDGTPHVLSNSWAMWTEADAPDYARDIRHPLNRLVAEAVRRGIVVVFAAGNCGNACHSDHRCSDDTGPGRAIWGANGHPAVVTVGAATIAGEFIGSSSPGPAALAKRKPDFVSISQFKGYSDESGTSAACAVTGGVMALLKQAFPVTRPELLKECLSATARSIGPSGFNPYAGHGIINAAEAYTCLRSLAP